MRPLGDTPSPRASDAGASPASQAPRMRYTRPVDESVLNDALQQPLAGSQPVPRDPRKHHTPQPEVVPAESPPKSPPKHSATQPRDSTPSTPASSHDIEDDVDSSWTSGSLHSQHKLNLPSPSLTPMLLSASGPASAVSGVSSRRGSVGASLSEETDSQAPSAGEELEPDPLSRIDYNSNAVELVMPSIKLPTRRPFTEEGKRIGRLKVLLAGDSGVGKTALIKAIVQTVDAIVHVDAIPSRMPARARRSKKDCISEILASTKPKPEWWSELNGSQVTRSRRSSVGGDTILDRNICFIDTPGYSDDSSSMETITPTVCYVQSFFEMVSANGAPDPELLNMLGGDGGNQVNVVLYLIKTNLKPVDFKYLQLLAPLTNVIPVIAQADTMTPEAIAQCKLRIRSELTQAGIRPFSFKNEADWPCAVSSVHRSDHDIMDASVLMSPDYQQPLVASELASLTEQIFCENGASWLRHAAAQKYLQWKECAKSSEQKALYEPLTVPPGPQMTKSLIAVGLHAYSEAGLVDVKEQEERLARIRLKNWASHLQRDLRREQAQYEATAREQRSQWLFEKLGENVRNGRIVAVRDIEHSASDLSEKGLNTPSRNRRAISTELHQDPLRLIQVTANIKARSWEVVRLLGGFGLLGGLTLWVAKQGWYAQAIEWAAETWAGFGYGER